MKKTSPFVFGILCAIAAVFLGACNLVNPDAIVNGYGCADASYDVPAGTSVPFSFPCSGQIWSTAQGTSILTWSESVPTPNVWYDQGTNSLTASPGAVFTGDLQYEILADDPEIGAIGTLTITTVPLTVSPSSQQGSGSTLVLNAGASGGTSPYVYQWTSSQPGETVAAVAMPTVAPSGTTTYTVTVKDAAVNAMFVTNSITVRPSTPVTVPNVTGLTQAAATAALQAASLVVGTVTFQANNTVPVGNVFSQSPVGGTTASAGSAVNLTVSSGIFSVQATANPSTVGPDGLSTLQATVTGGAPPYTYLWTPDANFILPNGNTLAAPVVFGVSTMSYQVTVTDSHGAQASALVTLTVSNP